MSWAFTFGHEILMPIDGRLSEATGGTVLGTDTGRPYMAKRGVHRSKLV
jgi:hypothetical protein